MNFKNSVLTRAPTRICDIGGWTDTWFYPKGAVFNFCVDLYSYVRLVVNSTNTIKIFAENLKQSAEILNLKKIEYNGVLDLLKSAIKRMNIQHITKKSGKCNNIFVQSSDRAEEVFCLESASICIFGKKYMRNAKNNPASMQNKNTGYNNTFFKLVLARSSIAI